MPLNDELNDPRNQRLLRLFLKGNKDHAFICMDPTGLVTAWLGAAQEIFGYTPEEAVGLPLRTIFTPEDKGKGLDHYELEVARSNGRSEDDRWHVRKDGTRIWATGTVNPVRDEHGELIGFVKIVRDRTDLRGQLETLESHVAALRESRLRTHQFLNTLGHELRNPLGPVTSAAYIIGRLSTDPKVDAALQTITRQVAVLTRLVDDLMDVTRLETGKVELHLQPCDLRPVLDTAVREMQSSAAAKGLALYTILPAGALGLELDEERFQRVILNLLSNAIKYTPAGGSVWVKATQEGPDVVFRVEDTGIGIAPEMLPRIFELFTQEMVAADLVPGGLGVGLAMVREIVELHGGSVQARSGGVGKGSEFSVRLPGGRRPAPAG